MKPNEPSHKIQPPREFAEANGARAAQPVALSVPVPAMPPILRATELPYPEPPAAPLCPLCADTHPPLYHTEPVTLMEYPTDQRELLLEYLAATHPGFDPGEVVHRFCLERAERELQKAQMVCQDDIPHFIDLTLAPTPILPTAFRMGADERFTGRGVTMAFVDSGFYPHDDLVRPSNRIVAMYDAVRDREIRDIDRLTRCDPAAPAWHGTMTAAVAAGSGFLSGGKYRGLACNARLVLVRAMTPNYRIRTPQVVRALEWIRANRRRFDIRIVNLSLGVDETTDSLQHPVIALVEELSAEGVVVVAASGNNPTRPIKPPGAAPSAITVGGYNDHNSTEWIHREMWHSSYGNTPGGASKPELLGPAIWLAAPILPRTAVKAEAEALFRMACAGDDELREMIPDLAPLTAIGGPLLAAAGSVHARSMILNRIASEKNITANYKHVDGTSFAAPIVSSVVAQMLEARPHLTPGEVKEILMATAVPLAGISAEVQGHGLLAPDRAMAAVLALREPGIIT